MGSTGPVRAATFMENSMNNASTNRFRLLSACLMTVALGFAGQAVASPPTKLPPPDSPQLYDAGSACEFPLRIELAGSNYHLKEFFDKNDNLVRLIIAGKGSFMTLTNMDSGATISLKAYGFSAQITNSVDGSTTQTITGHVLLTMGPADVPAGPSTTLYVGRLVYKVDSAGVGTILSFNGKSTDICAALD
jgi:hypothetical protein